MLDKKQRSEWDAVCAAAFKDLETPLTELQYMARCASYMLDEVIGTNPERPGHFFIPEDQRDAVLFAVNHLHAMIKAVVKDWYATAGDAEVAPD